MATIARITAGMLGGATVVVLLAILESVTSHAGHNIK